MSLKIDGSMLSLVPFNSKIHGPHKRFKSGYEYGTYDYNGKTWIVTNELENSYAKLQDYCWEQEYTRVQSSMEQLCTPYVKLTQEMLGSDPNSINFVPGSIFYLDDPTIREAGLSQKVEIRVTNNGLEAYYGKQRLASSTYASKVRKENDTVKVHNIQRELANGTRNLEFHQKMGGGAGYMYCCALKELLNSLDKMVRFANGQLDASELGVWDEKRFKLFLEYTGVDLDYTREFSINGQKLSFHNIYMDDSQRCQYAKIEYVGDSRDAKELGLLDTVIEVSPAERLNQLIYQREGDSTLYNEKQEPVNIIQILQEQWNNYIKEDRNAAKELLMEQFEMRNWNEFFKQRELEYIEKKDEENANKCNMIASYFETKRI